MATDYRTSWPTMWPLPCMADPLLAGRVSCPACNIQMTPAAPATLPVAACLNAWSTPMLAGVRGKATGAADDI